MRRKKRRARARARAIPSDIVQTEQNNRTDSPSTRLQRPLQALHFLPLLALPLPRHHLITITGIRHLIPRIIRILRIHLNQHARTLSLQNLRVDDKRGEQNGRLGLIIIVSNPMIASRGFIPALTLRVLLGRFVVKAADDLAREDISDYRCGAVPMRGRGAVGCIVDPDADDGFRRVVCQCVLVLRRDFGGGPTVGLVVVSGWKERKEREGAMWVWLVG